MNNNQGQQWLTTAKSNLSDATALTSGAIGGLKLVRQVDDKNARKLLKIITTLDRARSQLKRAEAAINSL